MKVIKFVAAVGIIRKKNESPFNSWNNFQSKNPFIIFAKLFSRAKMKILEQQINVQILDRVSELRAHYPMVMILWDDKKNHKIRHSMGSRFF